MLVFFYIFLFFGYQKKKKKWILWEEEIYFLKKVFPILEALSIHTQLENKNNSTTFNFVNIQGTLNCKFYVYPFAACIIHTNT